MKTEETTPTKKTDSRKFVVWFTWVLLVIALGVYTFIVKQENLLEKALDYFFAVSMMYLGVNVGQKVAYAFSDTLKEKYSKENENE